MLLVVNNIRQIIYRQTADSLILVNTLRLQESD